MHPICVRLFGIIGVLPDQVRELPPTISFWSQSIVIYLTSFHLKEIFDMF